MQKVRIIDTYLDIANKKRAKTKSKYELVNKIETAYKETKEAITTVFYNTLIKTVMQSEMKAIDNFKEIFKMLCQSLKVKRMLLISKENTLYNHFIISSDFDISKQEIQLHSIDKSFLDCFENRKTKQEISKEEICFRKQYAHLLDLNEHNLLPIFCQFQAKASNKIKMIGFLEFENSSTANAYYKFYPELEIYYERLMRIIYFDNFYESYLFLN